MSTEERLPEAARTLAILALQTNEYHRGNKDFRDAVDDVLAITRPVAEKACDEIARHLERGFTLIEAMIVLAIIGILASVPIMGPIHCRAKWEDSGFRTDWGFISGCRISKDGKTWIPEERYREIGS